RRRIHHVGCDCPHDNQIYFLKVERMRLQKVLHCSHCQITGSHTFLRNMTLADSHPFHDPFIRGVDHFFQVSVCKNARGQISPDRADFCAESSQEGSSVTWKPFILKDCNENVYQKYVATAASAVPSGEADGLPRASTTPPPCPARAPS